MGGLVAGYKGNGPFAGCEGFCFACKIASIDIDCIGSIPEGRGMETEDRIK